MFRPGVCPGRAPSDSWVHGAIQKHGSVVLLGPNSEKAQGIHSEVSMLSFHGYAVLNR